MPDTTGTPPRFVDKVAVVTGGASGIGRATVERFVCEGARVVVGDVDRAALDRLDTELGDAVATVHCDVTSEPDVERMAATAIQRFGRLDVAFANAGIGTSTLITDADLDQWRAVVDVCLVGPLLTIKHCAPLMRSGGSIVITTSLNAVQPGRGMSAYCAAKAGASMLAQVAALELGSAGIRVNAVAPGLVRTQLTTGMWHMPTIVEDYVDNTPLGRYASPEDIANVVAFLASDEANFVSGAQYLVDGGAATKRYPDVLALLQDAR
jgi:NAD(P)-dependent dehydrogenase (short-subunit alcohol dehydrogenase family)